MGQKTVLFPSHEQAGARIVDFSGWDMPLHYGSQIEEHHAVRTGAGVFDVSHMTVVDVVGTGATGYLRHLLANDVASLEEEGRALYSAMLNDDGKVLDDLITYRVGAGYRIVVNCATTQKDLAWMRDHADGFEVSLEERSDLSILAVQGPTAIDRVKGVVHGERAQLIDGLRVFQGLRDGDWFIARTGYTGEKGLEIILPDGDAPQLWERLLAADVHPIGLAARDSLRLEAGMNLYGSDMDETVSPLEANMARTVTWEPEARDFIGRAALEREREEGVRREQVGIVLNERGVMRAHYKVSAGGEEVGEITSGSFSPTLGCSIALALVDTGREGALTVEIRGRQYPVDHVTTPFVRNGKRVYKVVAGGDDGSAA